MRNISSNQVFLIKKIHLRQAITALAEALGLVGIDEKQHGERVGYMALQCAQVLGWSQQQQSDLFHAGLLHDCGVSSSRIHTKLVTELDWDGSEQHCLLGAQLFSRFRPLAHLAPIIRFHHTHWDELASTDLDNKIAQQANLIYLVDRVDALLAQYQLNGQAMPFAQTRNKVQQLAGSFFHPDLVQAFLKASDNDAFWLNLEPLNLVEYIREMSRQGTEFITSFEDLRSLALVFAYIVDAKSRFTYEHSLGVAHLAVYIGELAGLAPKQLAMIEIAALLHDLGKLGIPDEVLEKPGQLDQNEIAIMHRHSYDTYRILHHIEGLEEIALWAGNHHETLLGDGYPFHHNQQELPVETRAITVADIFQALAQDRPYRASLPVEKILDILTKLAEQGRIDNRLVSLVDCHRDQCWEQAVTHSSCVEAPELIVSDSAKSSSSR